MDGYSYDFVTDCMIEHMMMCHSTDVKIMKVSMRLE